MAQPIARPPPSPIVAWRESILNSCHLFLGLCRGGSSGHGRPHGPSRPPRACRRHFLYGPTPPVEQSVNNGDCVPPSTVWFPLPIPVHGSIAPPKSPLWQSNTKQKSVVTSSASPTKLLHPVPGPARRNPPAANRVAAILNARRPDRMSSLLFNPLARIPRRRPAPASIREPDDAKYSAAGSPLQANPLSPAHSYTDRLSRQGRLDPPPDQDGQAPRISATRRSLTGWISPRSVTIPAISLAGVTSKAGQ